MNAQARRGDTSSCHHVTRLFHLRRLLPAAHPEQADGKRIAALEAAIARRPERPREVRQATAQLLHVVVCAWERNLRTVKKAAAQTASTAAPEVEAAQGWLELQEMWIKHQNVGADLYRTAAKALMKTKGDTHLSTDEILDLMTQARLSGPTEKSMFRNNDLASRAAVDAMRTDQKKRAKCDELMRLRAKLRNLLAEVDRVKAAIAEAEAKRAAEADLESSASASAPIVPEQSV